MSETISASPLAWPTGWQRTPPGERKRARFTKGKVTYNTRGDGSTTSYRSRNNLSISDAVMRVQTELERMRITRDDIVVSTNLELRLDGFPRSNQPEPADPGTAVYWAQRGKDRKVMAIDLYDRVADNIAAIAASLEALRSIERHGGARILDRAFTGFTALPAPGAKKQWHEVFGVPAHEETPIVEARFRELRSAAHPDRPGGSHDRAAQINVAWQEFAHERGCKPRLGGTRKMSRKE